MAGAELFCIGEKGKSRTYPTAPVVLKVREEDGDRALYLDVGDAYILLYVTPTTFWQVKVGDSVAYEPGSGVRIEK